MKQIPKTGNINSFTNGRVIEEELSVHQKVVGRKELNLNKSLRAECGILWRVRTFVNLDRRVCTHQLFSMLLHHKFRRKEIKAENLRGLPSMTQVEENSAHFLQPFYMLIKSWKLMNEEQNPLQPQSQDTAFEGCMCVSSVTQSCPTLWGRDKRKHFPDSRG